MTEASVLTERLTASRLGCLRRCPYEHRLRYELRLARVEEAPALRFGSAFHKGQELRNKGMADVEVLEQIAAEYGPEQPLEREIVTWLLCGHWWYYGESDNIAEIIEVEQPFDVPLLNPTSGLPSRTFTMAGKMDLLCRLTDGRLAVLDYKTTSEDISSDSAYWLRLRQDQQISLYVVAARRQGYEVDTVMYDVVRKPTISPRQIPELDDDGYKIVVDEATGERVMNKNGGLRQSADSAKGWKMITRTESVEEFGRRLQQDISDRPDHYFARREVPRLDGDLKIFEQELWNEAKVLRQRQLQHWWTRTVNRWTCGSCAFADLCLQGIEVRPEDEPPAGYVRLASAHPELDGE